MNKSLLIAKIKSVFLSSGRDIRVEQDHSRTAQHLFSRLALKKRRNEPKL